MVDELFYQYFEQAQDINNEDVLEQVAKKANLTFEKKMIQQDPKIIKDIDLFQKYEIGVSGVPFFIFNKKSAVSGAQDTATFLKIFKKFL